MPSMLANMHDCPTPQSQALRSLLVLWQDPRDRSIQVIGQLGRHEAGYSFSYSRCALEINGFRPLPGLRDLATIYYSETLFPVFSQRVMSPSRPDYVTYLSSLGLAPDEDTPWEQILRSGGVRESDTLQFMELPLVSAGAVRATFLVNGVRHIPSRPMVVRGAALDVSAHAHESALASIHSGEELLLLEEDNNPRSVNATLVANRAGVPLGYVPEVLALGVRELLRNGRVEVRAVRVNGPEVPPHIRLVTRLTAEAQNVFSFDPAGRWDPLADR